MVVKRVGMSTTPLGMYLQIKTTMSNIPKSRDISSVLTEKTSKSLAELTVPKKTYADRTVLEEATPRPNH